MFEGLHKICWEYNLELSNGAYPDYLKGIIKYLDYCNSNKEIYDDFNYIGNTELYKFITKYMTYSNNCYLLVDTISDPVIKEQLKYLSNNYYYENLSPMFRLEGDDKDMSITSFSYGLFNDKFFTLFATGREYHFDYNTLKNFNVIENLFWYLQNDFEIKCIRMNLHNDFINESLDCSTETLKSVAKGIKAYYKYCNDTNLVNEFPDNTYQKLKTLRKRLYIDDRLDDRYN